MITTDPWILLVEDNDADRELTLHALARSGCGRVEWDGDGVVALERLLKLGARQDGPEQTLPRVIFLDIKMPRMGGIEVLTVLKATPVLDRIPVVVLTSSAEEVDLDQCYALGVNSFVVKPVDYDAFHRALVAIGSYWFCLNRIPGH
jgi:CheY-like chemotaxis protein